MDQSDMRKHIALVESYNQASTIGINEQDPPGPPSRKDVEQRISGRHQRVAPGMFIIIHDGTRYDIPMKKLPCAGSHGPAEKISWKTHSKYGDYLQFYVTCDDLSPEPGREYSVRYWINDGTVEYNTVN